MMVNRRLGEESIFRIAADMPPSAARSDYLQQACGDDEALFNRVLTLLKANDELPSFLEFPPPGIDSVDDVEWIAEKPGDTLGRYKLLEQIGEGGFGVVFMAEQQEPVRRNVALKIIKPGMDSKQVVARFEAERQVLALMDHPNIARVLDAGTTESARPYFVMELVRGVPITEYCDQNNLSPSERLILFGSVCRAVQHAHHKGIIHRDIKPSNVMITMRDDRPMVKVIDFGVAKATNARLTEKTFFTRFGQMVGTPLYMSPEQAAMSEYDVDTRSDIYSLGVLLYELLTGTTPFEQARLRDAAYDEFLTIIRDEDPPKPSTRVATAGETVEKHCVQRRTDAKRLGQFLRGELDSIVMKSLEKDRGRRYETAGLFDEDVQRFLNNEPVIACPPSTMYKLRKFTLRNKTFVVMSGLVTVSLVFGLLGTSWQAIVAKQERNRSLAATKVAELEKTNARSALRFLAETLEQSSPNHEPNRDLKVRTLLDRATARLETAEGMPVSVEANIRQTVGRIYWGLGEFEIAEAQLIRAYELLQEHEGVDHPDTLATANDLANLYWLQSDFVKAEPLFAYVSETSSKLQGEMHPVTLRAINGLGIISVFREQTDQAERLFRNALAAIRTDESETVPKSLELWIMRGLGLTHVMQERFEEAEPLLAQVLQQQTIITGEKNPDTLVTKAMMAGLYLQTGQLARAEPLAVESYQVRRSVLGDRNAHTLSSQGVLARLYLAQGRKADSEPLLESLMEEAKLQQQRLPPFAILEIGDVGLALLRDQNFTGAETFLRLYLEAAKGKLPDRWRNASIESALGTCLMSQQRFAEAEPLTRKGLEGLRRWESLIPQRSRDQRVAEASNRLTQLYDVWKH